MRKIKSFLMVGAAGIILTSCATVASPALGTLYTDAQAPVTATNNEVGSKVGTGTVTSILGWVATGDASINSAAKNAGITKISHVDYKSSNILGIIAKYEVVVYGN